jgi:predicted short-subunit dehydrogenase-like oxidoreductase (DUF2520 family)
MLTTGFIGAGITGTSLAVSLQLQGYPVVAVFSRTLTSAKKLAGRVINCQVFNTAQDVADKAQLVFITTPDDVIGEVVTKVHWHKENYVVHCSGVHSTEILESAKQFGAGVGCFHPLQTLPSIEIALKNLPRSTFAIEAEEPLLNVLKEMATALKGTWLILKASDKVLYHTAAVFASNYLVTLFKLASDIWQQFGVSREQAVEALMPLMHNTLSNIENIGLPYCLTGPIARGDVSTIRKHVDALEETDSAILSSYKELGLQTIPIAREKGQINPEKAQEIQALLLKQLQGVSL